MRRERKADIIIILLFLSLPAFVFAQADDPSGETDWDSYQVELYSPGDQTFMISLGVMFPLAFINNGEVVNNNIEPPIGGTGSLIYNYFLTSKFFIGGEISGMFLPTIREYTLYVIPLGFRFGTQFIAGRFEFPIAASVGMAWHTYIDKGYYGLYLKGGGSAFFRATAGWAFGISTYYYWLPQWTDNKSENVDGHFLDLTLSARYHF